MPDVRLPDGHIPDWLYRDFRHNLPRVAIHRTFRNGHDLYKAEPVISLLPAAQSYESPLGDSHLTLIRSWYWRLPIGITAKCDFLPRRALEQEQAWLLTLAVLLTAVRDVWLQVRHGRWHAVPRQLFLCAVAVLIIVGQFGYELLWQLRHGLPYFWRQH